VDFYCHDANLIVEVDGPVHQYTLEEDAIRQEFLKSLGYKVLRFTNEQVMSDPEGVLEALAAALPPSGGEGCADQGKFTPEDIFCYVYAILYAPTYRERYTEFLRLDFPRIPFPSDYTLFAQLADLGQQLVDLHLLRSPSLDPPLARFEGQGDHRVGRGRTGVRYDCPTQRVYINVAQYFAPVPPEVWEYRVGGYQVCEKWLQDRVERSLTLDEVRTYCRIVTALEQTIHLQGEIDTLYCEVEENPLPIAL
ncbi:MAG: type ISP restriction/modification enzyme, partial [Anaerolineae bacterium]